jgi:hypothetical protein
MFICIQLELKNCENNSKKAVNMMHCTDLNQYGREVAIYSPCAGILWMLFQCKHTLHSGFFKSNKLNSTQTLAKRRIVQNRIPSLCSEPTAKTFTFLTRRLFQKFNMRLTNG